MTSAMDMTDPVVQDMLAEDRREALARIRGTAEGCTECGTVDTGRFENGSAVCIDCRGTVPTPNELTKILADVVAPFGCVVSYDHTGGNCGAVGVYRSDASGMGEPVGAYLLVSGSEGPWPYSSAAEPLDVQWSDDDVDPDWDDFAVFMYSDEVEAFPFAAVRGVDALVTVVVGWGRVQS